MKTATLLVLVLLVGACSPESWEGERDGWVMAGELDAEPAGTEEVLRSAWELLPCSVSEWGGPWGGEVVWHSLPWQPDGVPYLVSGLYTRGTARVEVLGMQWFPDATQSALAHELGHYVIERCHLGAEKHHSAFHEAWVAAVNAQARWYIDSVKI